MASDNNIIRFPGKKQKPSLKPVSQNETSKARFDLEQRKVLVSASLVSIVLVVTFANQVLMRDSVNTPARVAMNIPTRSLASVQSGGALEARRDQTTWEKQVAHELGQTEGRLPASLGRTPSAEEKLQYGLLEGKYSVQFHEGKISEIQFGAESIGSSPTFFKDAEKFLKVNRSLLPFQFDRLVLNSRTAEQTKVVEKYDVLLTDQKVGRADFELDSFGRLLSLKLSSLP